MKVNWKISSNFQFESQLAVWEIWDLRNVKNLGALKTSSRGHSVNQCHFPNKLRNGNKWLGGFGGARLASADQDSPASARRWTQTPLGIGRKAQEARNLEKWRQSGRKMKGGHAGVVGQGHWINPILVRFPHWSYRPPVITLNNAQLMNSF